MEETLRDFALKNLEQAKKIIRGGKELTPMLIGDGTDGPIIAAVPEYGNPVAKYPLREMLKGLLREHACDRYCFIMEAWMGSPPGGKRVDGYQPSNDPDRWEAIAISAADRNGEKLLVVAQIKRSEGAVEFRDIDPGMPMGPLADLFDTDTRQ